MALKNWSQSASNYCQFGVFFRECCFHTSTRVSLKGVIDRLRRYSDVSIITQKFINGSFKQGRVTQKWIQLVISLSVQYCTYQLKTNVSVSTNLVFLFTC